MSCDCCQAAIVTLDISYTSDGSLGVYNGFYPDLTATAQQGGLTSKGASVAWYELQAADSLSSLGSSYPNAMSPSSPMAETGNDGVTTTHPLDSTFTFSRTGHPVPIKFTWDEDIYDSGGLVSSTAKSVTLAAGDETTDVQTSTTPPSTLGGSATYMVNLKVFIPNIV